MKHELKTLPEYFEQLLNGKKNFEIRFDDRHLRKYRLSLRKGVNENVEITGLA